MDLQEQFTISFRAGRHLLYKVLEPGGTLNFKEADKASGSTVLTFAPTAVAAIIPQLRVDLYGKNAMAVVRLLTVRSSSTVQTILMLLMVWMRGR